ncbi:IS200/IS605 family element transposase accessory protein TnpB [Candidatus Dependentiae bacterium]|nr:IS200/IS605 family element transposase accessory protein TnpB [Candidatus Dependentiae bacterium]
MPPFNQVISKALIKEALKADFYTIALEKLTNIRKRSNRVKRMNIRFHSWVWAQLQRFILYKAQAPGLKGVFANPAFTNPLCADCGSKGIRSKHRFQCKQCGIQLHSDVNARRNIRRIAVSADAATGTVSCPYVAASRADYKLRTLVRSCLL